MAHSTLMTVGMKCPKPLFEVHKMVKQLAAGELLKVVADDPAFQLDIQAWCRRTGNELVSLEEEEGRFVAMVRKA